MISFQNSTKGVSVILGYAMILSISVVLIGLLVSTFGGALTAQEQYAIENEMEIAATQMATEIENVDITVQNMPDSAVEKPLVVKPKFTDRAGDPGYQVYLDSTSYTDVYELRIETQKQTITKRFRSTTDIDTTSKANSTSLHISYDPSSDSISLTNIEDFSGSSAQTLKEIPSDYDIPDNSQETTLDVGGNITGGQNAQVIGSMRAEGDINTEPYLEVYGHVTATNAQFGTDSTIEGNINVGNSVDIGESSTVKQTITSGGNIVLRLSSSVGEYMYDDDTTIDTTGDVTTDGLNTITGTIESDGVVTLGSDTTVTGDVVVNSGSDLVCGVNVTINGKDCTTYKNDNY